MYKQIISLQNEITYFRTCTFYIVTLYSFHANMFYVITLHSVYL